MAKIRNIIIIILITVAVGSAVVVYFYLNMIPEVDPTVGGNTTGNLYNGGYFCEMDGKVYFRNNYDNGCMYSMNVDETDIKPVTTMNVYFISGNGNYLYFYMDSQHLSLSTSGIGTTVKYYGVYQCHLDGTKQKCLYRGRTAAQAMCGNYIYFQVKDANGGSLLKIKNDKTNLTTISDEYIDPCGFCDGKIYFTGVTKDHNLYMMDTLNGDKITKIADGYIFYPIYHDGYIYYMDAVDNYHLKRMDLSTMKVEKLTNNRVECFNLNDQYIFYSVAESLTPALHVMTLDGSSDVAVHQGIFFNISLTSQYVYYTPAKDNTRMYHMPIDGSQPPSLFNPME
jgi:hypothetical protein